MPEILPSVALMGGLHKVTIRFSESSNSRPNLYNRRCQTCRGLRCQKGQCHIF